MNWPAILFASLFGCCAVRAWREVKDAFVPGAIWETVQAIMCIAGWLLVQP